MSETISLPEAAKLLQEKERILILTHERPDGDAFGSALGMQEFLRVSSGSGALPIAGPQAILSRFAQSSSRIRS